jgi:hypothetical protein
MSGYVNYDVFFSRIFVPGKDLPCQNNRQASGRLITPSPIYDFFHDLFFHDLLSKPCEKQFRPFYRTGVFYVPAVREKFLRRYV